MGCDKISRVSRVLNLVLSEDDVDEILDALDECGKDDVYNRVKLQTYCIFCPEVKVCEDAKKFSCELELYRERCLNNEAIDYTELDGMEEEISDLDLECESAENFISEAEEEEIEGYFGAEEDDAPFTKYDGDYIEMFNDDSEYGEPEFDSEYKELDFDI